MSEQKILDSWKRETSVSKIAPMSTEVTNNNLELQLNKTRDATLKENGRMVGLLFDW